MARLVEELESGQIFSTTLRRIFRTYHGLEVGLYSHGSCFVPGNWPPGTRFGRYCSIAAESCAFNANHPLNFRSMHALFFNPIFGLTDRDLVPRNGLTIGNDVWIGRRAIILPSVSDIADGAVIGAGAVVHKNVPPYAVVTGNPGRVVRYRFSQPVIQDLLASRWWEQPVEALLPVLPQFQSPLEEETGEFGATRPLPNHHE